MLLNTAQTAQRFGVEVETVRGWAKRGNIPVIRISGRMWFDDERIKRLPKITYKRADMRATACIGTLSAGREDSAIHQYRLLTKPLRARVDAWCARKGIPSPGLRLKQMQLKRLAVVLDMTCEGAD